MYERLNHVARRLIVEAHRRSLWQVLGVYLVTAWVILQVVGELTRTAGLPPWVPSFALVLLLVGLPIVMATAIVQEGGPGSSPSGAPPDPARSTGPISADAPSAPPTPAAPFLTRQLTWKRALAGGAAAFGLLGLLVAAYLLSWKLGVGPVGSLVAKGALEEGERIVLADFGAAVDEAGLGAVITDALRIDLLETPIVRVLEPPAVRAILARMQVPADAPLDFALAREAALREGVKAVLEGSVARAGSGYVLTATLRAAETGESLAAFRETARGPDDLIPAIDRLSRRIRERVGESLRSIRAGPGLEQVTTSSLDALRLYGAAIRAFAEGGDYRRTIALLEEALALDPEFAMAWRALAVALGNAETDRVREMEASVRAYELRHRLTERERQLATADYHRRVTRDRAATIAAYRRVLELDPQDRVALNNLSSQYSMADDREAAVELLRRAIAAPDPTPVAFINLVENLLVLGWLEEAKETAEAFARHFPDSPDVGASTFWVHFFQGDLDGARSLVEAQLEAPDLPAVARSRGHDHLARIALTRGHMADARAHFEASERAARNVIASYRLLRRLFSAHAEIAVGNPERGLRLLRQAEADGMIDGLVPVDQWHFFRAILFGMAGLPDEVEATLASFDRDVPVEYHEAFGVRNESARFFIPLHRGEPEAAIRIIEGIRSSRPCRVCYAERMGWALWEAGRLREAAEEWEVAVAWQDRTHALIWHHGQYLWTLQRLPALYEEIGDTARAIHHYQTLARLWADADPELQPRTRHALQRIAALGVRDP